MIHQAIITGSTGLVGQSLVKYLLKNQVDVLCLGRKNLSKSDINKIFGKGATYSQFFQDKLSSNTYLLMQALQWHNCFE